MSKSPFRSDKNQLLPLLALVFLVRFLGAAISLYLHGKSGYWSPDSGGYVDLATSLLHRTFSSHGVAEIFRTPGYPLLLAPAVACQHVVIGALFANFVIAVIGAWFIWLIAKKLMPSSGAAKVAVLLYCFEPLSLLFSEKILSDVFFSVQLLFFIWLMVRFFENPTYLRLALSAFVLGLASYTRPVTLFLGLWSAPVLLFFPRKLSRSERFSRAILFPTMFMLILAPWVLRNARLAGYSGFSSVTDHNLYFYSAAAVRAKLEHKDFFQLQDELGRDNDDQYFRIHPEQRNWSQGEIFRFQRSEAQRFLVQHWLIYAGIHLRGCAIVLLDPGVTDALKFVNQYPEAGGLMGRSMDQGLLRAVLWLIRQYPEAAVVILLLGTQLFFYYAFAFLGLRRVSFEIAAFFSSLFFYFVLISGSGAVARYRLPIMPLVCILAGLALTNRNRADDRIRPQSSIGIT